MGFVEGVTWIVEWDIPSKPTVIRRRFYKELKKLRKAHKDPGFTSTFSVLRTRDEGLARTVFELAKEYGGRAALYRAIEVARHDGGYKAILPSWPAEAGE